MVVADIEHPDYENEAGELMRWCALCGDYIYGEPCDDRVSGIDDL